MKRKLLPLIVSFILISAILPLSAHAHRGKTDGAGGHTDHSTGEYHYHHGYPAHDHYDVDGDGVLDCPYDFDDQTATDHYPAKDGSESAITERLRKISISDVALTILMILLTVITVPIVVMFLFTMIPPLGSLAYKIGCLFSTSDDAAIIVIRLICILIDIYLIYRIIV